ncbi:ATP/GTP phosphatase [Bacteroidia bacterium]|nr:ATP/GTP phosphatase [Bacteroidia bacterium]
MVHLESLSLENFRGFDRVEINGFSKINVLLGKNNCGKTSILEAIFLLTGMGNPQLPLNINSERGIRPKKETLRYLFHNFVTEKDLLLSGKFSGNVSRKLAIKPTYESSTLNSTSASLLTNPTQTSIPVSPEFSGLDFKFSIGKENKENKEEHFDASLWFEEDGKIRQSFSSSYKEKILSFFFDSSLTNMEFLSKHLQSLMIQKKEKTIIDLLNSFDHTLTGINLLPDGIYLDKKGVSELMPLKLMGRGVIIFFDIATTIAANKEKNFICLIDEIENGLHYSTQRLLWQSLFSLTRETNVQLFITTHSLEMLQTLSTVINAEAYEDVRDDIKVFTIANTAKAGFQSYGISHEGLESAIENQVELRS